MTAEENIKFRESITKQKFKEWLGYDLNLENPKTFNEKIQWLKLYHHDPLITKCADKYLVREYIKEKIGEEYLIPLLGVWDKVEDIDFDALPNQFVLKINWGCSQNIIVKDKSQFDIEDAKNKLNSWLNPFSNNYYWTYEWSYKNINPKIICEKYIEQMDGNLYDYKVFCFNGKAKYIGLYLNRGTDNFISIFYDTNWKRQNFTRGKTDTELEIEEPAILDNMLKVSSILANSFPHVRVDFYNIKDKLLFGELTFYTAAGLGRFEPVEWDYKFAELLELPKEKNIEYDWLSREELIKQCSIIEPISYQYKEMQNTININNNLINEQKNIINDKNNLINHIYEENNKLSAQIETLNNLTEELKLKSSWFRLFSISNNKEYIQIVLFGIKLTLKINENVINKIAWWIPVKKWRDNFRDKFRSFY